MAIATDPKKTVKQRVAAMAEAPLAISESGKEIRSMLEVLAQQG